MSGLRHAPHKVTAASWCRNNVGDIYLLIHTDACLQSLLVYTSLFKLIALKPSSLAASCLQLFSANNHTCSRDIPCTQHDRCINYLQPTRKNTYFTSLCFIPACANLNSTHLVDGSRASGVPTYSAYMHTIDMHTISRRSSSTRFL